MENYSGVVAKTDGAASTHLCLLRPLNPRVAERDSMGARLERVLRARGVQKISPLALELGVNESCISRWRRGGAISTDNAIRLCRALDISLDWLLSGRGHMDQHKGRAVSDREFLLLERLRSLPEKVRETLLSLLEIISGDT